MSELQKEICMNGFHISPGDLYIAVPIESDFEEQIFQAYCFPCAEYFNHSSLRKKMKKVGKNTRLMIKRGRILDEWGKQRSKVLGLVSWNYKYREVDEKIRQIQFECTEESWERRLERIKEKVEG